MIPSNGRRTRTLSSLAIAGALAASSLLSATSARAGNPGPDTIPISVVAISTQDADEQADGLTKALRSAIRTLPGWSLLETDYALEVLVLQLKCSDPPDAACLSRIADQIKADRFIWGSIKKRGSNVTGELHLWVRGKGSTKIPVDYSANLSEANDEALKRIANDAILTLTGGAPKGSVHVKAGNVDGQVFVDTQPVGALSGGEGTFLVGSGTHRITVKAHGYGDVEGSIEVKPGATTEVSFSPSKADSGKGASWRKIGGYIGLGSGAVFAGIGFYGMFRIIAINSDKSSLFFQYRNDVYNSKGSTDACKAAQVDNWPPPPPIKPDVASARLEAAKSACSTGSSLETLQYIMFPAAAVAGGAGIYLLLTAPKEPPKDQVGLQVLPQVGPGIARLDLKYTF